MLQLLAVQNVDLVRPMLDHAFSFALWAMANAVRFEYTHHRIRTLHGKPRVQIILYYQHMHVLHEHAVQILAASVA